jgi:hypothetical protein
VGANSGLSAKRPGMIFPSVVIPRKGVDRYPSTLAFSFGPRAEITASKKLLLGFPEVEGFSHFWNEFAKIGPRHGKMVLCSRPNRATQSASEADRSRRETRACPRSGRPSPSVQQFLSVRDAFEDDFERRHRTKNHRGHRSVVPSQRIEHLVGRAKSKRAAFGLVKTCVTAIKKYF